MFGCDHVGGLSGAYYMRKAVLALVALLSFTFVEFAGSKLPAANPKPTQTIPSARFTPACAASPTRYSGRQARTHGR